MINRIFSNQMIESVGWAVVHSLWQSALIAILLAVLFGFVHRRKAVLRHNLAYGALVLSFVGFIATFLWYFSQNALAVEITGTAAAAEAQSLAIGGSSLNLAELMEKYLPIVFNVWFVGFVLVAAKMLGGWVYMDRLRKKLKGQLDGRYRHMMNMLKNELAIDKSILLALSDKVNVPMVAGYFKPVILIPVGLVNALTDSEVEAILAHELAHIKRNDFLFNLFQTLIETVLYFNPAIWWISSTVKNTREHCCDDTAISLCGNQLTYANALVKAEEWKMSSRSQRTFALSLLGQKENLLSRIKRILQQPDKNALAMEKILLSAGLLFCMVFFNFPNKDKAITTDFEAPQVEVVTGIHTTHSAWDNLLPVVTVRDSSPTKVIETITRKENDKEVSATYENGKLKDLKVNGKSIPENERNQYQKEIEQIEMERGNNSQGYFNYHSLEGLEELQMLNEYQTKELKEQLEQLKSLENLGDFNFSSPNFEKLEMFDWVEGGDHPYVIKGFGQSGAHSYNIQTEKSDDGRIIMRVETDGDEVMEIELDSDNDFFFIDGNEIKIGEDAEVIDHGHFQRRFHMVNPNGENIELHLKNAEESYRKGLEKILNAQDLEYIIDAQKYKELLENAEINLDESQIILLEKLEERELRDHDRELREAEREMRSRERAEERRVWKDSQAPAQLYTTPKGDIAIQSNDFAFFSNERDVNGRLERELVRDGIIQKGESYSMKFSGDKLKINGKKQSDDVYEKYKEIYEAYTGSEISKSKIVIENN